MLPKKTKYISRNFIYGYMQNIIWWNQQGNIPSWICKESFKSRINCLLCHVCMHIYVQITKFCLLYFDSGMLHAGIGETQLNNLFSAMNLHCIDHKSLKARVHEVCQVLEKHAEESKQQFLLEEAIECLNSNACLKKYVATIMLMVLFLPTYMHRT